MKRSTGLLCVWGGVVFSVLFFIGLVSWWIPLPLPDLLLWSVIITILIIKAISSRYELRAVDAASPSSREDAPPSV